MLFNRLLISFLLLLLPLVAVADDPNVASSLIQSINYFQEESSTDSHLDDAIDRFTNGQSIASTRSFLSFGISTKVTWIRLSLDNPSSEHLHQQLTTGQIWVDYLDIYQKQAGKDLKHWQTGDLYPASRTLVPVTGFVVDLSIPPGNSEIYIRAQSADPLTLPLQLQSLEEGRYQSIHQQLTSGILYGVLVALIIFNLVLYVTLKYPFALYYSVYMSCFIVMNFGYNGYAFSWLYPDSPAMQNFCTLFFMALHAVCGLVFVSSFLKLDKRMPNLQRLINIYATLGLAAITLGIAAKNHLASVYISFTFLPVSIIFMILIGFINLNRVRDARYFLVAMTFSMLGLLTTTLSVIGFIPYTFLGFHGAEIGVVCEAIILAVIIAKRLKTVENERVTAQYLATHDPLTQLLNRRSFEHNSNKIIDDLITRYKPASFIMIDIDHFKKINDTYGHHVGDKALVLVSEQLRRHVRKTDILARWGGEEIVLFLNDCDLKQALDYAERLRKVIESCLLLDKGKHVPITASFGVATRAHSETLEQLCRLADEQLYHAKANGRNRVEPALAEL